MFQQGASRTRIGSAFALTELIYHSTVRSVRKSHGNAVIGLLLNIFQTVLLIAIFYAMFEILGMRGSAIRGDFLLYIMSGVFLYMTFSKTMGAVVGSEGPTSPMMKHAPMNTVVAISSAASGALYLQVLSLSFVLFGYHAIFAPVTIHQPVGAFGMLLMAWFSGLSIGMVFLAVKPWFPGFVSVASTVFARANMIASGKMFLANSLPASTRKLFDWNPLFHAIDQERGFMFLNYNPHYSSISYPFWVSLVCLTIGLMGEFYTRSHASLSWFARR